MASVHPALPDADTLAKAASALVYDADGKEHSFGSLIQDKKTIVVFIRTLSVVASPPSRLQGLHACSNRLLGVHCPPNHT